MDKNGEAKGQILVYETENGEIKIDVRLDNETVWLTQRLMAELSQKDVRTINHHIQNIYTEKELNQEATIRKYEIVQIEGKRKVSRQEKPLLKLYILELMLKKKIWV